MKAGKLLMSSALAIAMLTTGCAKKSADTTPTAEAATAAATSASTSAATSTPAPTAQTDDAETKAAEYLAKMDLNTKIEQMMVPAVRTWNGEDFTVMNDSVAAILTKYHFGGIILFTENMTNDSAQAINLTQAMQNITISGGGAPLFIGADQECGNVYRLLSGTDMPSSMALTATGNTENAKTTADIMAKELNALGFNLDYAPDLDVNDNPANPVIGIRSYSDDGDIVAQYSAAFIQGMMANDIVATGKHFPGHGDTSTDSHTGLPQVNQTKDEIESSSLIPFREAIANGIEMIMSAHIQFPQIETGTYTSIKDGNEVYLPSTLSHTMITDILRNELGFKGVVSTDSLQMDAIKDNFSTRDSAKLAINAGVDTLLMPVDIADDSSDAAIASYVQDIADMVADGEIAESTIDAAVTRILTLKYRRGIMDETYGQTYTSSLLANAAGTVGTADNYAVNRMISDQAVTMLQNNNVIPYAANGSQHVVVLSPNAAQSRAFGFAFQRLQNEGVISQSADSVVISSDYGKRYSVCKKAIEGASLVIISTIMWDSSDIDYNRSDEILDMVYLIEHAKELGIPVIAVSTNIPYDAPLLTEADAVLCTYNWIGVPTCDNDWNPTQAYAESLPAALDVIFGKVKAQGKLPVNLYQISNGQFTSEIAWARGSGING